MKLSDARSRVQTSVEAMNTLYRDTLFDEWMLVSLRDGEEKILVYAGPRCEQVERGFQSDYEALREELNRRNHAPGDFEFAREAPGTLFDAFLTVGKGLYLLCNHTSSVMADLARNPRWIEAQVVFAEMSEVFRANPVSLD